MASQPTKLRITPNRRYYLNYFTPEEQTQLIAMLEQYSLDGIFPEIEDSMTHMAFGAIAKSIDTAKKRAATRAAKLEAAAAAAKAAAEPEASAPETKAAAAEPPAAAETKAAAAESPAAAVETSPAAEQETAESDAETQRIIQDFLRFYCEFPFKRSSKLSRPKAMQLWLDLGMNLVPIDDVIEALRRDMTGRVFKTDAPDMRTWLLREQWLPETARLGAYRCA
ncbi:MAG: DUF6291 domain-containing protein [Oscillospiraceae bacterium]|jgi:hypothetical protein|nr:DUF6291 domain-containing protein [Oscillospiraceae bacterium]